MAMRIRGTSALLGATSLCLIWSGAASAQAAQTPPPSTATPPAPQAANQGGLEEIIVTAQKRSENLQKVPIAVTAISGKAIADTHALTLRELQGVVPGVQLGSFANNKQSAVFTIRGIGVLEPDAYAGNTVGIVYDGVPQFFNYGALIDLFDIDRVEVLRGPQGTLFGANTTGGVVNIATSQPTNEFGGKAEVTYGNHNRIDAGAAINLPLSDTLKAKITVFHTSEDGWITNLADRDNPIDKRNRNIIRGYLKFSPAANFDATLIGEYAQTRDGAGYIVNGGLPGDILYAPGLEYPSICLGVTGSVPLGGPNPHCRAPKEFVSGRHTDIPDVSNLDSRRLTLTMNLRGTAIGDITSITGYRNFNFLEYVDQGGTGSRDVFSSRRYSDGHQFSQELRTSAKVSDRFNLTAGVFYLTDYYQQDQEVRYSFLGPIAGPGSSFVSTVPHEQHNYSISGFAQGYFDLTDKLQLVAGIRYQHEKTELSTRVTNTIDFDGGPIFSGTGKGLGITVGSGSFELPPGVGGSVALVTGKKSWNNVGGKLGLNYKPTDNALLYASWSRGFKSGGFVGRIGIPSDLGPYRPETVNAYEAGFKGSFFDRRLQANLSAFYTDYKDIQLGQTFSYQTPPGCGAVGAPVCSQVNQSTILNASGAKLKGFELEVNARPVTSLKLGASVSYLETKYKDFPFQVPNTTTIINLKGQSLLNAPKWTYSANAAYQFDLAGGNTTIRADYSYIGGKYQILFLPSNSYIQPTHLVGAGIDWEPAGRNWSISAWARNLFDKHYLGSLYESQGFGALGQYQRGRQFGGTVRVKW